jgi:hypothetical protein
MADLAEIMSQAAQEMTLSLAKIRTAMSHNLSKGEAAEETVRRFFRRYLPHSLGVTSGQVVDSTGQRSRQLDVIIYDLARTPILFTSDEDGHQLVPVEGVIAVVEVKSQVQPSDMESVVTNMLSVKRLSKSAYVPQGMIQETMRVHGREWDYFPTLYFLFAYESGDLVGINRALAQQLTGLPEHERVDMACLLSKGVLINATTGGTFDAVPSPGSRLSSYETRNALLVFYLSISTYLLQAKTRPIMVVRYMPPSLPL